MAVAEGLVIVNLVRLYRALGGGWDPDTAQPPMVPDTEDQQASRAETG
jgi:hypothetical protein